MNFAIDKLSGLGDPKDDSGDTRKGEMAT